MRKRTGEKRSLTSALLLLSLGWVSSAHGSPQAPPWGLRHMWAKAAALSPDNKLAIIACGSMLKLWDVEKEKPLAILESHTHNIFFLHFIENGKRAVSACANGHLKIHSIP